MKRFEIIKLTFGGYIVRPADSSHYINDWAAFSTVEEATDYVLKRFTPEPVKPGAKK